MGCDIHGVVEVFLEGSWQQALTINDISPRNYNLFALLFGVRGESPYEYAYRGFPLDMSWYSRSAFCDDCDGYGHHDSSFDDKERFRKYNPGKGECDHCVDWHSVSWITQAEIEAHWKEVEQTISGFFDEPQWKFVFDTLRFWAMYLPEYARIIEQTATLSTGYEDTSRVRMIVWFDN